MLDLIDGKGEVVLEEATAVMFWGEVERDVGKMEDGEGEG
jgi:hypothetical protein